MVQEARAHQCRGRIVVNTPKAIPRECPSCGAAFMAGKTSHTEDGYRKFCSHKCRHEGLKKGKEYTCISCNRVFYLSPSKVVARGGARCCSVECRRTFYQGVHSNAFKNGQYIHNDTGLKYVYFPRENYVGRHVGEHRVIASKEIGRLLGRQEFVLHINKNPIDNRPDNLYVCSNSEFSRRRNGSLPWPTHSNLREYK